MFMSVTKGSDDHVRRSLDEVNRTVSVTYKNPIKRLFAFLGPAYLVSVGYMDPGNWATDLEGGARFGYALLWVLLMSNLMAVLLQTLSARLGVVTGHDLAQGCRAEYSRPVNFLLWIQAEIAIAACDLAEVVGTIIALKLLFGIPLIWGCLVTAFDTFLLLWLQKWGMRKMEAFILTLVLTIGGCFLLQILLAQPNFGEVITGLRPTMPTGALVVAIGILGATVMPHNLYLHSALVQSRRIGADQQSKAQACRFNFVDSVIALNAAFFVNAAILIVSAAVFHNRADVASIEKAHELLPTFLAPIAPILFGVALLCAGQSSTLTGTLAGQIIMEGYLDLRIAPWLRRLITRTIALAPAVLTITLVGEDRMQQLLVLSQVVLSLQLAFAVIPLIHFTSNKRNMGVFATHWFVQILAWITAAVIVGLNAMLVVEKIGEAVKWAYASGRSFGPIGLGPIVAIPLWSIAISTAILLIWVIIKPWLKPAPPWEPAPSMELDWTDTLRPRQLGTIGIALEHSQNDGEIINRALSLAQAGQTKLVLLHVVDTPMTRVYGNDTLDRETDADERYLSEVVHVLKQRGFDASWTLLHGPNRAGELVKQLKRDPVDLLVVGSHGHGVVQDLMLGQTVDKVRHGLNIPMLIARPDRTAPKPSSETSSEG
jgi:manganese transport protein